ncbi:MAG: hypothetical protein ABIP63_08655 [Thermoanaerobaculia bacterium]
MNEFPDRDGNEPTSTPRWVKAFGAVILGVLLLFVLLLLFGGGKHGPGRHMRGSHSQQRGTAGSAPA